MGKMSHMVGRESDNRTQSGKELYKRVYNNERARTYRDGDEEDEHRDIRKEPSEGKQDTEYGTRSTDGIQHIRILRNRFCAIRSTRKEVEVEDVRGMVASEATAVLAAQGLNMEVIDSTYSDKVPFGTIVEQDPRPKSHAKEGRLVYVTVNATTKRMVTMPDLQDISYRQAETTLRAMGLRVDTTYDYKPSAFRDLVLEVKSKGETVQPGEKLPVGTRVCDWW